MAKILLSGHPQACRSLIWDYPQPIALTGDYGAGVQALKAFFSRLTLPEAQPLLEKSLTVLDAPKNRQAYFLLEAAEILDMDDRAPLEEQNRLLLQEIQRIGPQMDAAVAALPTLPKAGGWDGLRRRLSGAPSPSRREYVDAYLRALDGMGLDGWAEHLFFKPGPHEDGKGVLVSPIL